MLKKIFVLSVLFVSLANAAETPKQAPQGETTKVSAEEEMTAPWAVDAELLGPGVIYTLNASYRWNENWAGTLGFSRWNLSFPFSSYSTTFMAMPAYVSYYVSGKSNSFEVLGGFTYWHVDSRPGIFFDSDNSDFYRRYASIVFPTLGIGYSYRPFDGGFHIRATLYAFLGLGGVIGYPGLSLGYAF